MKLNLQFFGGRGASLGKTLANSLSTNQENAIEAYISGDMMWINQYLRGRGDFGELSENEKEFIDDMDKALDYTLGEEKLYRSVDITALSQNIGNNAYDLIDYLRWGDEVIMTKDKLSKMKSLADSLIGKEITEKGYMSTTKDPRIADEFRDFTGSENPIVIDFEKKKGLKGRDLKKFEIAEDPQKEVLLNRNVKYKITGFEVVDGQVRVKAKFI